MNCDSVRKVTSENKYCESIGKETKSANIRELLRTLCTRTRRVHALIYNSSPLAYAVEVKTKISEKSFLKRRSITNAASRKTV